MAGWCRLHEYHFDSFSLYFLFSPRPSEVASVRDGGQPGPLTLS